uniref:Reverse transcriptase domain-containing protein n=1 Tax=Nicotiana tabacum TaxID=4097 RepID=A0A1S4A8Z8_TOBAC|nr:PREDICTED: uncharacterized protein LOC107795061 [Nicotiana tabacum]
MYAKCDAIERIELWDTLYALASDMISPWIVSGDFNVIWDEEEKFGGLPVDLNALDDFRHWLEITHLSKIGYDHNHLLIKCDPDVIPVNKQFKFLNFWIDHATFQDVVKENWQLDFSANLFIIFNHKLKKLKKALLAWSKATYGDIFQKIASLEEVVMFKDGDRNNRFFHVQVNGRRRRLQLKKIQNAEGNWIEGNAQMAEEAVRFFTAKFRKDIVPTAFGIIDHVPNMVTMEHNQDLVRQPTKEEAKHAVFGLNGESAGGPDGFSGKFFHYCWEIIGDDVYAMVFSRVIHERVVNLLPTLISNEHARFVKGRSIVENVLLTQQIITDIRLRTRAGLNVVIKLDMTKAYDRLSWLFMTKMLRKMGFYERFIGIVYGIVANNWYSVLINGQPYGFFKSTRGIKQSYPLSPTLFILAAEALSRGLNSLHLNLYLCGFGLPKWSPRINHLAYADNTIIFQPQMQLHYN